MTTRTLSDYSYGHLTVDPRALRARPALCRTEPLPTLIEPTDQPLVTAANLEPLRPVADAAGVADLAAYRVTGWPGAPTQSLVRTRVVDLLADAAATLPSGFTLAVFDAWRPLSLQRAIYEAAYADPALPVGFVSEPSADPATPPPHLTGGTVDVTLAYEGVPLALGTNFDDFTARSHADALEDRPGLERDLRRLLYQAMSRVGFVVIACEWWHFEYGTRRWAALTGRAPIYDAATLPAVLPHWQPDVWTA